MEAEARLAGQGRRSTPSSSTSACRTATAATCAAGCASRAKVPIIMLTGLGRRERRVAGLDRGANDYIAKPFRLAVLLARLRAQLRLFENSEDAVFTIGPYTFRPAAKMLQEARKNRRIRLTEKESAILKFLYRAGTRPVPRAGAAERGLGLQRRR